MFNIKDGDFYIWLPSHEERAFVMDYLVRNTDFEEESADVVLDYCNNKESMRDETVIHIVNGGLGRILLQGLVCR